MSDDHKEKFEEAVGGVPDPVDPTGVDELTKIQQIIDDSTLQLPKLPSDPPSRPLSPTASITINCEYMIASQQSRLRMLALLNRQVNDFNSPETTIAEVRIHIQTLDEEWHKFNVEHEKIGATARRSLLSHPYMTADLFMKAFNLFSEAKTRSHRHLERLNRVAIDHAIPTLPQYHSPSHQANKLPDIVLPSFAGQYVDWPSFRDLFKSLVIDNTTITDVQRMHYLRSSLKDRAAQLVASMPLDGDSFNSAWDILTTRFENKRLLVSAHLSRITNDNSSVKCTSKDLNHLLSSLTESINALRALDVNVHQWDTIMVHLITQRLNRSLMESWENKLGSSSDLPTLEQLTSFLMAKARAQERLETTHPSTNSSNQQSKGPNQPSSNQHSSRSSAAHTASTTSSKPPIKHQYPCDLCKGEHYIVACPQFLALTPKQRHLGAVTNRLCFNCLGHHSLINCTSNKSCKTCGQKHHTMLHLQKESNQSTNQQKSSSTH